MLVDVADGMSFAGILDFSGCCRAGSLGSGLRSPVGFHWAAIRTATDCPLGEGVCSSTVTEAKKPESMSFERKSRTCCESLMDPRKERSPRRFMERDSTRVPGAEVAIIEMASR